MPDEKKTTMSVAEMGKMLGLGKTEPYWLVHKNCFETIMVNGKMRVVIESFEKWYANQTKRKKVNGPPPGEELRANSYSVQEIADMLSLDNTSVYYLIRRDQIPTSRLRRGRGSEKRILKNGMHPRTNTGHRKTVRRMLRLRQRP